MLRPMITAAMAARRPVSRPPDRRMLFIATIPSVAPIMLTSGQQGTTASTSAMTASGEIRLECWGGAGLFEGVGFIGAGRIGR